MRTTEIEEFIASKTQETLSQTETIWDSTPASNSNWCRLQVLKENAGNTLSRSAHQFDIVENAGSGDCLFYALLDFLRRHNTEFTNIPIPHSADDLRMKAVEHILKPNADGHQLNFERFKDNLMVNLQNEITCWSMDEVSDETMKESYSSHMTTPGNYGTTSELCVIAELFDFGFNIVRRDDSDKFTCYDYGSSTNRDIGQSKPVVHLLFTGNISRGHFRLMVPVYGSNPSIIPPGNYELIEDYSSSRLTSIALARPVVIDTEVTIDQPTPTTKDKSAAIDLKCEFCGRFFSSRRGSNVHRNIHLYDYV